jgi:hypothetical protein
MRYAGRRVCLYGGVELVPPIDEFVPIPKRRARD